MFSRACKHASYTTPRCNDMDASYRRYLDAPHSALRMVHPDEDHASGLDDIRPSLADAFCSRARAVLDGDGSADRLAAEGARAFLARRGFRLARLAGLPIGLVDSPAAMRQRLVDAGFTPDEVRAAKLVADQRLAGRLVGPIAGPDGRIVSLWARHPAGRVPRYLYWRGNWREAAPAVGIESAVHAQDSAPGIVLVDDLLDALLLQSHDMPEAAGLGDSGEPLAAGRWQRLAAAGARHVTLVLDQGHAAGARVEAALNAFFQARTAIRLFVLAPERLGPHGTPGEFVRDQGIEAFRALLGRDRLHAYAVRARMLLDGHRPKRGWTDASRRAAMKEAMGFYAAEAALGGGRPADLDAFFVPPVVAELGWPWGSLAPATRARPSSGPDCALHGCGETVCFCFD